MRAAFTWVDFSSADRDRMRRAIALFEERETRDELGLGTIRDALADAMFPGTSTIQTRLRYFLFVPWIYLWHERNRTASAEIEASARKNEIELVDRLLASPDHEGTIGRRARDSLLRLPSSIYWAGLQRWEIFLPRISIEEYHSRFDSIRRRRVDQARPDDGGIALDPFATWHPRLPPEPTDFMEATSLEVTRAEAEFIQGRIVATCQGTLLAYLATRGVPTSTAAPWLYPERIDDARLRDLIDLARRFSLVMHGAALVYNAMLAELQRNRVLADEYSSDIEQWATGRDEGADLTRFDPDPLWRTIASCRANVPPSTRVFVEAWAKLLSTSDPRGVIRNETARRLVQERERRIKGARSRFANQRALDQWSGASGAGRLNYRWAVVQRLLNDLHAGLAR